LALVAFLGVGESAFGQETPTSNYHNLPRAYLAEISPAAAYRALELKEAVLIDVRTPEEYEQGHVPESYNFPFPYVKVECESGPPCDVEWTDAEALLFTLLTTFPDKDTMIITMCHAGFRSVQAANALAIYGGYTNVHNLWTGYVGRQIENEAGEAIDVDNSGTVGDIGDMNGWAGFAGLPTSTDFEEDRVMPLYLHMYASYEADPDDLAED